MKLRWLTFAFVVFACCPPTTPPPSTTPNTSNDSLAFTSNAGGARHFYAESTGVVIPDSGPRADSSHCPQGRLLISTGSGGPGDPGSPAVLVRDLNDTTTADSAPINQSLLSLGAKENAGVSSDQVLVRRGNGDLVLVWAGATWDAFPHGKPAWGDWVLNGKTGMRAAMFTWTSSDCGAHWKRLDLLDTGDTTLLGGDLGWPQENWFGGFDREELYADPFSGNVYMAAAADAGGNAAFSHAAGKSMLVFVLEPAAKSWKLLVALQAGVTPAQPNFDAAQIPVEMTTTEQQRLYLVQCSGAKPMLYWMDKKDIDAGKNVFSGSAPIYFEENGQKANCGTVPAGTFAGNFQSFWAGWPVISHWYAGSTGGVRVGYPSVEDNVQVVKIVGINDSGSKIDITPLTTVGAGGGRSVMEGAFVENDPSEHRGTIDTTAFYFLAGDTTGLTAMYTVFRGPLVEAVKPLATKNGQPLTWTPNLPGTFGGDYVKGWSFWDGSAYGYFMQWPQSEPGPWNQNLHYRIVKVTP